MERHYLVHSLSLLNNTNNAVVLLDYFLALDTLLIIGQAYRC